MYEAKEDKKLLRYLRDDLHLTATKDGCSEGACGTCTGLVDGKKVKACIPKISTLEGKEILTVEGIDAEEMKIYQHCFAEAGAVQCGFCIPGMVISAKSLLDVNLNPTRKEVKQAIRGNLYRCTGYKKIEDAILMVADYFRETKEIPAQPTTLHMNEHFKRIDAWEIRRRNAIKPGDVLPNGQTADANMNIVACLEAVKDVYYQNPYAGIACGFKNAGTGMGKKDIGRILLSVEQGKIHIRTSASCMVQGIGQMVLTEICHVSGLDPALFVFEAADTVRTPNSGTSTASRQTVVTGEAARRVGEKLKCALDSGKTIADLEGQEFFGEYSVKTDPLGTIKDNPVSHVSYSYGTQVIILDEEGEIEKAVSAFDVGTPVNIQAVEGQIEGGMIMGIGYGVTEEFKCEEGYPKSKFGNIGL